MLSRYKSIIVLFPLLALLVQDLSAQEQPHHHTRNHLGAGIGLSKVFDESGLSPAWHLHYSRTLGEHSPLAFTTGFERIVDEHKHTTLAAGLEYAFLEAFSFKTALGLTFLPDKKKEPGIHFELAWSFDVWKIHLGPMVEYGLGLNERHTTFGLHAGIGF